MHFANKRRAAKAAQLLRNEDYKSHFYESDAAYYQERIQDTLTDLRHLCDILGVEWDEVDTDGYRMYVNELESPEG